MDKKELAENKVKSSNDEKSQGVKRKREVCDNQMEKENSKKAYVRWVQAYKTRWKEQKEKREIPLPNDTT